MQARQTGTLIQWGEHARGRGVSFRRGVGSPAGRALNAHSLEPRRRPPDDSAPCDFRWRRFCDRLPRRARLSICGSSGISRYAGAREVDMRDALAEGQCGRAPIAASEALISAAFLMLIPRAAGAIDARRSQRPRGRLRRDGALRRRLGGLCDRAKATASSDIQGGAIRIRRNAAA